jgi:ABC-2 type transport system permease protein
MIARLVVFELALLVRERRALAALACLALLVVGAFVANTLALARDDAAKAQVAAAERARWLGQGAKDPHSAAHSSIYAFKPAPALAALDLGVEPFVGQAVWLEAHVQNDMLYRPQGDASALERAGLAHPASLLVGFAPLVAFLLAFSTAARERERGTLRLALGAARSPFVLAAAKTFAIWLVLAAALVAPLALAAVVTVPWSSDALLRLAAWCAAMTLYLGTFAAIGVAASLAARDGRVALVGLLGTWALAALVLPRLASTAVDAALPLPSTQAVKQQLVDEAPSFWTAETSRDNERAILAQAGVARREELAQNYRGLELDYVEKHSHAVFDRVLGAFYDRVVAQDRAYAALAWLSPAVAASALSPALAGTDFAQHRRFIDAAETYRRDLVNRMNREVVAHKPGADGKAHTADATLWATQPAFRYTPPTLAQTRPVGWLAQLAWMLAAFAALAFVSRRLTA